MNKTKQTFSVLFAILVILLLVMPFITTFNEFLTLLALKFEWYRAIESWVVPFELRSVIVFLKVLGIEAVGSATSISVNNGGSWQRIWISWNCVGWQSAILLILTLVTGLQGNFKTISKAEAIMIGVLGTFIVNIVRMSLVVLVLKFAGYLPAVIFHDYFANIAIILWFFGFWWFSYKYVLEERGRE